MHPHLSREMSSSPTGDAVFCAGYATISLRICTLTLRHAHIPHKILRLPPEPISSPVEDECASPKRGICDTADKKGLLNICSLFILYEKHREREENNKF